MAVPVSGPYSDNGTAKRSYVVSPAIHRLFMTNSIHAVEKYFNPKKIKGDGAANNLRPALCRV